MQQYITGLLLLSGACAAVLSGPQHPYTPQFPKRFLLQHVTRCDNTTQVRHRARESALHHIAKSLCPLPGGWLRY